MSVLYSNTFKKKLCQEVCLLGKSTLKTAEENNVPLKTFEKWITSFHKDSSCFDDNNLIDDFHLVDRFDSDIPYDDMSYNELKLSLMKKDIEIARLKKAYMVKGGGTEEKVFITFSKKNMK